MKKQNVHADSELKKILCEYRQKLLPSEEIARNFMLASALEPLAIKDGCTTRLIDIKPSKKLEFFVSAGINCGFVIARFVEYLLHGQVIQGAYKFFPEAIVASKLNRRGGKINQGILEALFPIMAAQALYPKQLQGKPFEVFDLATELLKKTSPTDVADLIRGKELANKISGVENKYPVKKYDVETVYDYYCSDMETEKLKGELTGILHNAQFVNGFEDIKTMLGAMMKSGKKGLLDKSVDAYNVVRTKHANKIGVGLAADHSAVCLYVYLTLFGHRDVI